MVGGAAVARLSLDDRQHVRRVGSARQWPNSYDKAVCAEPAARSSAVWSYRDEDRWTVAVERLQLLGWSERTIQRGSDCERAVGDRPGPSDGVDRQPVVQ